MKLILMSDEINIDELKLIEIYLIWCNLANYELVDNEEEKKTKQQNIRSKIKGQRQSKTTDTSGESGISEDEKLETTSRISKNLEIHSMTSHQTQNSETQEDIKSQTSEKDSLYQTTHTSNNCSRVGTVKKLAKKVLKRNSISRKSSLKPQNLSRQNSMNFVKNVGCGASHSGLTAENVSNLDTKSQISGVSGGGGLIDNTSLQDSECSVNRSSNHANSSQNLYNYVRLYLLTINELKNLENLFTKEHFILKNETDNCKFISKVGCKCNKHHFRKYLPEFYINKAINIIKFRNFENLVLKKRVGSELRDHFDKLVIV